MGVGPCSSVFLVFDAPVKQGEKAKKLDDSGEQIENYVKKLGAHTFSMMTFYFIEANEYQWNGALRLHWQTAARGAIRRR